MLNLLSAVYKVYSGRAGQCGCGCSGRYRVASQHRDYAGQERGYAYDSSDVSDDAVRRTVGKILAAATMEDSGSYIHAQVGGRVYVAYYDPKLAGVDKPSAVC